MHSLTENISLVRASGYQTNRLRHCELRQVLEKEEREGYVTIKLWQIIVTMKSTYQRIVECIANITY